MNERNDKENMHLQFARNYDSLCFSNYKLNLQLTYIMYD